MHTADPRVDLRLTRLEVRSWGAEDFAVGSEGGEGDTEGGVEAAAGAADTPDEAGAEECEVDEGRLLLTE